MKRALRFLPALAVPLALMALAVAGPAAASAVDLFPDDVCKGAGADSAACSADGSDPLTGTDGIIRRAANLISAIAGVVAVVGILIGSILFVTSGGDTGKVSSAKKTITYSLVGIIIILLARTIVVFVVSRV